LPGARFPDPAIHPGRARRGARREPARPRWMIDANGPLMFHDDRSTNSEERPMTSNSDDPQITTEATDTGRVIKVVGELDLASAPTLADHITTTPTDGESVTLDLSGVSFIDSSALRALVVAGRELS